MFSGYRTLVKVASVAVLFECLLIISVSCELPKITGLKVSFLEPVGVYVEWDTVDYQHLRNVKGYEIKVWQIKELTTRNFKLLNGDQYPGLEANEVAQDPFSADDIPMENLNIVTNFNPYHTQARLVNITFEKLYEIRVNAYNLEEKGPMADPIRVKILKSKTDYTMSAKVVKPQPLYTVFSTRRLDSCGISIFTNTNDEELFVHKSHL